MDIIYVTIAYDHSLDMQYYYEPMVAHWKWHRYVHEHIETCILLSRVRMTCVEFASR